MNPNEESITLDSTYGRRRPWTWWRIVWNLVTVVVAFVAPQIAVFVIALLQEALTNPAFDLQGWAEKAGSNGLLLSISTFASASLCVPLIRFLTGLAEKYPWEFLAVQRPSMRQVLSACAVMAVFLAVSDSLNYLLGRPLVPKFMIDAYNTARWPLLLLGALAIAAPIAEELVFRGLIFSALRARGVSILNTAIVTSLVFASLHLQYDLFDMVYVFFMGLLFAGSRVRYGSIVPGMAMHALANTLGFIEVALIR